MPNKVPRRSRFTILCNDDERALIKAIAQKLRRSQGDAVRYLLVEVGKSVLTNQSHGSDFLSEIFNGNCNSE